MKRHLLKSAMAMALALLGATVPIAHAVNSPDALPDPASQIAETRISVRPLDLSRAPTKEELMAAGQLGGILYPTHELTDKKRDEAARLDFGKAIEDWNKHNYTNAIVLFKKHVQQFPDSPWAAEATLHMGCDATYNGRYTEAEAIFTQLITTYQTNANPGAQMMLNKARQRLALVKVEENNLDDAINLFIDLEQDSPDWKQRTYATHWLQRLSQYTAAREALVNCGANALGYIFEKEGNTAAALRVRQQIPQTMRGHSLAELVKMAESEGLHTTAIFVTPEELAQVALPAVLHISEGISGDKGHYWVLDKIQGDQLELFDPQSHRRFHQTLGQLTLQWSGKVLEFSRAGKSVGRELDLQEMSEAIGGCCGVPAAPSNQGDPGDNGGPGGCKTACCSGGAAGGGVGAGSAGSGGSTWGAGAPVWQVNMVNMNFYMTDTPMWYDPPIGPPVRISLSYNSQSSIAQYEPFGSKWTFAYGGYLVMDTSGTVTVFMPDGRMDIYTPNGVGGFNSPFRVYSTLTLISANHYELNFPDGTVYVYSIPSGTSSQQPFLTAIRDAYGNALTLGYNSSVQLSTITDAQGKVFTFSYNSSGLVANVADPFGRNATFQYDANKNLIQITDMGGYWSSFTYNTNVFLTSITDARGTWNVKTEPADGIPNGSNPYPPPGTTMWQNYRVTVTNPLGQAAEYQYDGYFHYSWFVSPRDYIPYSSASLNNYSSAAKTLYTFTTAGSGNQGEIANITYPAGDYVQYNYNSVTGDRVSMTDSAGHSWHYTYNSVGRVTSITDAKGTSKTLIYSTNGWDLASISNALGQIILSYDSQHDVISFSDYLTNTTTYAYNSYGQITSVIDALGITNEYFYDGAHQLSALTRAGQGLISLAHDAMNRLTIYTDATGFSLNNSYNNLNQLTKKTYSDGRSESYVYSTCCPNLIDSITDRAGRTTYFTYDAIKRFTVAQNPEGGLIQISYDANGNKTQLIDPNNNITSMAYDLDDRMTNKTYADGHSLSISYDQVGLVTRRTDARGIVTTYTYDANNNLLTGLYSDGTPGVTNTFDAFNRLVTVNGGPGITTYGYDNDSRVISVNGPWSNATINYSFDPLGRLTNVLAQGGTAANYSYDPMNRLTGVQVGQSQFAYTYVGDNPLAQQLNLPNGSYTTYQYDPMNRLTDIASRKSTGQVINEFSYTYNAQDMRDSESVSNGEVDTIGTNQLVTYNYNRLNQILASTSPTQAFLFDSDGNMIRGYTPDGYVFSAAYDAENRLTSLVFTNGSNVVLSNQYIYHWTDFLAQEKQYRNGTLTKDARILRAAYFPLQERDSNNVVVREYSWDFGKPGGIGGLLNLINAGQNYSCTYDGKGNVATVLDSAQDSAAVYSYDAFGIPLSVSGVLNQPFSFSTKPYDSETGLSYFGFRFYSPACGHWLTRDPLGGGGGINLYAFVFNNPINYKDPYGLDANQCSTPSSVQNAVPSGSPNSCKSFYSSSEFSQMPVYQQNATTACESTGNGTYATAIRLCLQQQQQQYLQNGGTLTVNYIYQVHQTCYQQAGCSGTPAGLWAWWGVTHIPIPWDTLMNKLISYGGSCSGIPGNFEGNGN